MTASKKPEINQKPQTTQEMMDMIMRSTEKIIEMTKNDHDNLNSKASSSGVENKEDAPNYGEAAYVTDSLSCFQNESARAMSQTVKTQEEANRVVARADAGAIARRNKDLFGREKGKHIARNFYSFLNKKLKAISGILFGALGFAAFVSLSAFLCTLMGWLAIIPITLSAAVLIRYGANWSDKEKKVNDRAKIQSQEGIHDNVMRKDVNDRHVVTDAKYNKIVHPIDANPSPTATMYWTDNTVKK